MSQKTDVYDKTLQPGDLIEFVDGHYCPYGRAGKTGRILRNHAIKEAVYFELDDKKTQKGEDAGYKCSMRRLDDAKSFIPEDWS